MKKILFIVSAFISICLLTACSSDSSSNGGSTLKYEEAFKNAIDEYVKKKETLSKTGGAALSAKGKKADEQKNALDKSLTDLEAALSKVDESGAKYFENLDKYANGLTDANQKTRYQKRLKSAKTRFAKEKAGAEKSLQKLKKIDVKNGSKNINAIVEYAKLLSSDGKEFAKIIIKEGASTADNEGASVDKNKKAGKKKGKGRKGGKNKKNKKPIAQEEEVQEEVDTEEVGTEEDGSVEVNDSTENN